MIPHQGIQEKARRVLQIARGFLTRASGVVDTEIVVKDRIAPDIIVVEVGWLKRFWRWFLKKIRRIIWKRMDL